jgi:uncharacterized LabA/DUF88 family protein
MPENQKNNEPYQDTDKATDAPLGRVYGFVDGFNLYHALEHFEPAVPVPDPDRFQKYKWLCLTSLFKRFIAPHTEALVGVELFTAYPNWTNSDAKRLRHQTFVSAQEQMGVHVTFGEFRSDMVTCRMCRQPFRRYVEKQTDINIAISLIKLAGSYDKAILLTADSDQVPTIRLLKNMYPEKRFAIMPPIGRGAKELRKVCHEYFRMTEDHLAACQLPNPFPITKDGRTTAHLIKPTVWP